MSNGAQRLRQTLNANSSSEVILIPLLGKEKREVNQVHECGGIWGEGGWFTQYSSIIRRFSVIPIQDLTAPGGWMKSERGLNEFSWSEGCFRFHFVLNEGKSGGDSAYGNLVWAQLQAHRHVYGAIGLVHAPSIGENTSFEDLDRELDGFTDCYRHVMVKRVFVFDHNFEAGPIPRFNASQHVVLPPAPEGLDPIGEATIMERFLAEPLYDVAVNLINGYDTIIKDCSLVSSPSSSRSQAKGVAKPMLPSLYTHLDGNSTDNDSSGGGAGFFENISAKRDRQYASRLRKYMGDISLLAGSPKDAMYFYDTAVSELKSDHVWLAAALEGSAAAFAAIKDPAHPIAISPELFSFISKVVTSLPSSSPGPYGGTAEVGSDGGAIVGGSLDMLSRAIVDRCSESLKCMNEKKELRTLELELWFKLARFHFSNRIVDAAIDCLLHIQDITLSKPRYDVQRAVEAALLCHEMGLRRKAAFFVHIASLQCREFKDWNMAHAFARISARAYGIEILGIDEASSVTLPAVLCSIGDKSNTVNSSANLPATKNEEEYLGKNSTSRTSGLMTSSETLIDVVSKSNDDYSLDQSQERITEEEKVELQVRNQNMIEETGGKSSPVWPLDRIKFSKGRRLWIALQKNLLQDLLTLNGQYNDSRLEPLQYYTGLLRIIAIIESTRQAYDMTLLHNHSALPDDAGGGSCSRNAGIIDEDLFSVGSFEFKPVSPSLPASSSSFSPSVSRGGGDKEEQQQQFPTTPASNHIISTMGSPVMNPHDPGSPLPTGRKMGKSSSSSKISSPPSSLNRRSRIKFASLNRFGRIRESCSNHDIDRTLSEGDGESAMVAHRVSVPVEEQVELVKGMTQCAIQLFLSIPHNYYSLNHCLSPAVYYCPLYPSLSVPGIPYLESVHPIQLPPNMDPVVGPIGHTENAKLRGGVYNIAANKDQAADASLAVHDLLVRGFYFNPYEIGKAKGRAGEVDSQDDGKQKPIRWVVGEMCFIHAKFSNPLSVVIEATKVEAAVEGAETHVYATSFILPPHSKSVPIQLSIKPKEPGNLTLRGVYMTVFGLPILCPIKSNREQRRLVRSVMAPVWEYPWPPEEGTMKLLLQPRKCKEMVGCCGTDEKIITDIVLCPPMPCLVLRDTPHSDMEITVHPGERCKHVIRITNRSDTPVGALELWLETKSGNSLLFSSLNQNQNKSTTTKTTMGNDLSLSQGHRMVHQQQPISSIIMCDNQTLSDLKFLPLSGGELHIPLIIQAGLQGKADNNYAVASAEDSIQSAILTIIYSSGHEALFTRRMKLPLIVRVVPGLRFTGVHVGFPWHDSLVVSREESILTVNSPACNETDSPDALIALEVANDSTLPMWVYSKASGVTAQVPPSGSSMIPPGSTQSLLMSVKRRWVEVSSESIIMKERRVIGENDEGLSEVKQEHHPVLPMKTDFGGSRCWKEQHMLNILSDLLTLEWFMTLDAPDTIQARVVHSGCVSFPLRYVTEEKEVPASFAAHIQLKQQYGTAALPAIGIPNYLRALILPPLRLAVLPHKLSTTTSTPMTSLPNNSSFPVFDAEKCLLNPTAFSTDIEAATCASTWKVCIDMHVSVPVTVVAQNLTSADTIRLTLQLSTKSMGDTRWIDVENEQDGDSPIKVVWSGMLDAYHNVVPPKGWVAFGAVAKFVAAGEYVLSARAEWQVDNTDENIQHSDTNGPVAAAYKPNATRSILNHAPLLVKVSTKAKTVIECEEPISNRLLHGKIVTRPEEAFNSL